MLNGLNKLIGIFKSKSKSAILDLQKEEVVKDTMTCDFPINFGRASIVEKAKKSTN